MSQPIQNDTQQDAGLRQIQGSSIKTRYHVMRLLPGQDLKLSLHHIVSQIDLLKMFLFAQMFLQ